MLEELRAELFLRNEKRSYARGRDRQDLQRELPVFFRIVMREQPCLRVITDKKNVCTHEKALTKNWIVLGKTVMKLSNSKMWMFVMYLSIRSFQWFAVNAGSRIPNPTRWPVLQMASR